MEHARCSTLYTVKIHCAHEFVSCLITLKEIAFRFMFIVSNILLIRKNRLSEFVCVCVFATTRSERLYTSISNSDTFI